MPISAGATVYHPRAHGLLHIGCVSVPSRHSVETRSTRNLTLRMIYQPIQNSGQESKFSGGELITSMHHACAEARELYRSVIPEHCVPVMTGFADNRAIFVTPLQPVVDDQPDPIALAEALAVIDQHPCDRLWMFYPVMIDRPNDESMPQFGVIVEVQTRGITPLKRLIIIERDVHEFTRPLCKLPVLGRAYGVYYPHLLDFDTRSVA